MTRRLRIKSVRFKIAAAAVVAVLAALLLASGVLLQLQRRVLVDAVDTRLTQRVTDVSDALQLGDPLDDLLRTRIGDDIIVQLIDDAGRVIGGSTNLDEGDGPMLDSRPLDALSVFDVARLELPDDGDEPFRVATMRVQLPDTGHVDVIAAAPTDATRESLRALTRGLLVAIPALLALLGSVVWVVTGRALRPVEAIRAQVDGIDAGDLDQRVPSTGGDDEIDRLASTMNGMLSRLERASTQQRDFVADAAHELRTPLTGIITQLEAAKLTNDLDGYEESARVSLTEAHRMRRLVQDLLVLAHSDANASKASRGLVDLDDIVFEQVALMGSSRVSFDTSAVSGGQIRGDADQLRQTVRNLFDNAQRHAKTSIRVALSEDAGHVRLTVGDDGPGVPIHERERIFDRFVRLDLARARRTGGSGLGLAITRSLVESHGATISVSSSPLGGAQFDVLFPPVND